jgi:hypothetical protein
MDQCNLPDSLFTTFKKVVSLRVAALYEYENSSIGFPVYSESFKQLLLRFKQGKPSQAMEEKNDEDMSICRLKLTAMTIKFLTETLTHAD